MCQILEKDKNPRQNILLQKKRHLPYQQCFFKNKEIFFTKHAPS